MFGEKLFRKLTFEKKVIKLHPDGKGPLISDFESLGVYSLESTLGVYSGSLLWALGVYSGLWESTLGQPIWDLTTHSPVP